MKRHRFFERLRRIWYAVGGGLGMLAVQMASVACAAQEEGKIGIPERTGVASPEMEPIFSWSGYIQALLWMGLLLVLLWGLLWLLRKSGKFTSIPIPGAFPRDGLRMEAQLSIGPKKGLVVVRYLNKRLLLGVTEQQISLLQESALEEKEEGTVSEDSRETKDLRHDAQLFAHLMRDAEATPGNDKS